MESSDILLKIPAFRGMDKDFLNDLVNQLEEETYPAGATVIREGAIGDSLYIIARGSVNIYKSLKEKEDMLINTLKRNQYFGEIALIDNLPRSASVITGETSVFLRLRKASLDVLLKKDPEMERIFYKNFLSDTIRRYREITSDITFYKSDLQEKSITLDEINKDLSSAKKLQDFFINTNILDYHSFPIPGMKQSYMYHPTQEIGGDFINLSPISEYEFGSVITDVMGHGITAALAGGAFKSAFALLLDEYGRKPSELLVQLNNHFLNNLSLLFASCQYAYINLKDKEMKMARAGHYFPMYYDYSEKQLIDIKSAGPALGIHKNAVFEQVNRKFNAGDKLLFFTDGIIEQRNYDRIMYSEDRLRKILLKNIAGQNPDILKEIERDLNEFTLDGKREDDISLLLMEFS
jgi:serine phosphatase RsbU (regulator of sigma subunit)